MHLVALWLHSEKQEEWNIQWLSKKTRNPPETILTKVNLLWDLGASDSRWALSCFYECTFDSDKDFVCWGWDDT